MLKDFAPVTPFYNAIHIIDFCYVAILWPLTLDNPQSQSAFTCSKLTIETLEQGVKDVQFPCSNVSIVNFEQVMPTGVILDKKMPFSWPVTTITMVIAEIVKIKPS